MFNTAPLDVIITFYPKRQVFYLGPLVHAAMDDPEGFSRELQSALGEFSLVSRGCVQVFDVHAIINS